MRKRFHDLQSRVRFRTPSRTQEQVVCPRLKIKHQTRANHKNLWSFEPDSSRLSGAGNVAITKADPEERRGVNLGRFGFSAMGFRD